MERLDHAAQISSAPGGGHASIMGAKSCQRDDRIYQTALAQAAAHMQNCSCFVLPRFCTCAGPAVSSLVVASADAALHLYGNTRLAKRSGATHKRLPISEASSTMSSLVSYLENTTA